MTIYFFILSDLHLHQEEEDTILMVRTALLFLPNDFEYDPIHKCIQKLTKMAFP